MRAAKKTLATSATEKIAIVIVSLTAAASKPESVNLPPMIADSITNTLTDLKTLEKQARAYMADQSKQFDLENMKQLNAKLAAAKKVEQLCTNMCAGLDRFLGGAS